MDRLAMGILRKAADMTEDFDREYDDSNWKEKRAQREALKIMCSGRSRARYVKILHCLNTAAQNAETERSETA